MNTLAEFLERRSLYFALAAAWIATLGSLYFSEVMGFVPCTLCWYQRILMYPLALILAIGLGRTIFDLPWLVLPFSLAGLSIATYHYLLEKTMLFGQSTVCAVGASCVTVWINWFGFVTIPLLSLVAFLIITVMTLIALNAGEPDRAAGASPWLVVVGSIGVILAAFAVLTFVNRANTTRPAITLLAGSAGAMTRVDTTPAAVEPHADGARLYAEACASCHGARGERVAGVGNALAASDFIATQSDAALLTMIRNGRAATDPANTSGIAMPASGGRPDLTDDELLAIIYVLRSGL